MDPVAGIVVYSLLPYVAAFAGVRLAVARGANGLGPGRVTAALVAVVAVSSVIGLAMPSVLHILERNTGRIEQGEVWRLVTALFQQDGGVIGTLGNLVVLLVIGSVYEHLVGGRQMVAVFLGVGILAQLPALVWQPVGAGNSVANLGLAGAVAMVVLLDRRRPGTAAVAAALTLLTGVGLTAATDVHGPAVLLGAAGAAIAHGVRTRGAGRAPA
ncbi:rhomboid family intramembrane serine protease [Janibacter sp. GS2]|uniref:rhomboid family intramembrane serine protease n=1 Tax=Janibacter sp. GS2 TaxID=3442646 RepID=UPI003EB77021